MESTLRNSNEIICKHRNLRLQVRGKVGAECGLIVSFFNGQESQSKGIELRSQLTKPNNWGGGGGAKIELYFHYYFHHNHL